MGQLIRSALLNWILISYFLLFTLNSLAVAALAALQGEEWGNLTQTAKVCVILAMMSSWTTTMLAFLNRAASRIAEGKSFISTGDTMIVKKSDVQQTP